ncbi:response regulator transcription factor [Nonomuraea roseoviolacea subsp. roseoviolacea]|uniref:DNA-binding NarL/FixJ family response regulator n=1 Tax=Nonomuraea roseoviolacea subsp. carminata TaxID=160689 RepID=A0ABT1KD76_9ACTN|nr:response regulator transcription factor [Nonomuraea roseoviolacea]MCP2351980.1 DNA-binding NarL/FixJ family response regulator [Nonomuraea roseoviolacea subsp. carminata]
MRVFLVDDHPVVRAGLVALLGAEPDMEVVGEAGGVVEALSGIAACEPDVVLMDLQLGDGIDGVEAIRRIGELSSPPRVLVLTTYESDADVMRAVDAGATGYLLKVCPPEELFQGIRAAAGGRTVLSAEVASRMMRRLRAPAPALSVREVELLELLASGAGNREIARRLFITEATVKTHLVHIYGKLGVDTRTAAVTAAVERRLIRLPGPQ